MTSKLLRALLILIPCLIGAAVYSGATAQTYYEYDELGRLIEVERTSASKTVVYTYDELGNRASAIQGTAPEVQITVDDVSVAEGGNLVFTITKSGATGSVHAVNYATANGTAASGDYTSASSSVSFGVLETTKTVSVSTSNDSVYENNETVLLNLSGATNGAVITDNQGVGTINNNDTAPSFAINNVTQEEGVNLVFTVTKTGSTALTHNVNYATANGTASAGSDYTATSGTLSFTSGEASKTITITGIEDTSYEGNETFYVNLSSATAGATISDDQGLGTITNDDSPPNNPPIARNDSYSGVNKNNWTTFSVLNNDNDPDYHPLTITSAVPTQGSVNIITSGTKLSFNCTGCAGNAYIYYDISDGHGGTDSATVTVSWGGGGGGGGLDP